jgi:protein-disulfide isomerase
LQRYAKRFLLTVAVIVAAGGATLPARAQGITVKQADELLQQNRDVLNELKQIHQLMERQLAGQARPAVAAAPPPDDKVHIEIKPGAYSIGRADAPLTMVEYTDYQCPFCRQFHIATFEEIKKNYIDTGKLRYVSRDFPLDMHENAPRAAMAARCAADQGKFWELRHVMIVNASQLQSQNITTYATDLKLDADELNACVTSGKYRAEVDQSMAEGRAAGVSGTPSFVLGRTEKDAVDGVRIVGAQPYAVFDFKLKELLEKVPPS